MNPKLFYARMMEKIPGTQTPVRATVITTNGLTVSPGRVTGPIRADHPDLDELRRAELVVISDTPPGGRNRRRPRPAVAPEGQSGPTRGEQIRDRLELVLRISRAPTAPIAVHRRQGGGEELRMGDWRWPIPDGDEDDAVRAALEQIGAALGAAAPVPAPAPGPARDETITRVRDIAPATDPGDETIIAQLRDAGVKIDPRWSSRKLRERLAELQRAQPAEPDPV